MGKQQLKAVKVPKYVEGEERWVKVCVSGHYIQAPADIDVPYALADTVDLLADIEEDDCFRFRTELDDNYVNDGEDTLWVLRSPHIDYTLALAKF